jgi:hypothetical protein
VIDRQADKQIGMTMSVIPSIPRHILPEGETKGFYPVNVLNAIKQVPEDCRTFYATANPAEVISAETAQGRVILGVVDGLQP